MDFGDSNYNVQRRRTAVEATAEDPEHHRYVFSIFWGPNVQVKAILGDGGVGVPHVGSPESGEGVVAALWTCRGWPEKGRMIQWILAIQTTMSKDGEPL